MEDKTIMEWERLITTKEEEKKSLLAKSPKEVTEEELDQLDAIKTELDQATIALAKAKRKENFELEKAKASLLAGAGVSDGEGQEIDKNEFMLVKAIKQTANRELDGFEREMNEEGRKEINSFGKSPSEGSVIIPQKVMTSKAMTVGSLPDGGNTVDTIKKGWIDSLRDKIVTRQMGATFLSGLESDIEFDRQTSEVVFNWSAENASANESNIQTDKVTMRPNRLTGYSRLGVQLLAQSSYDIEKKVRESMIYGQARAFDLAAINGSGAAPEPLGLLNTTGIGSVATGALSWANLVAMETEVANDNADEMDMGYIFNTAVRGLLKTTQKFTGTNGTSLMENKEVNGYKTGISNLVPADTIAFGNFKSLMMGTWGGLEIIVDPYTRAKEAQVDLVLHFWGDVAVEHPESFSSFVISQNN